MRERVLEAEVAVPDLTGLPLHAALAAEHELDVVGGRDRDVDAERAAIEPEARIGVGEDAPARPQHREPNTALRTRERIEHVLEVRRDLHDLGRREAGERWPARARIVPPPADRVQADAAPRLVLAR